MSRVTILFEGMEKNKYGHIDGDRLKIAGSCFSPEELKNAGGTIKTLDKKLGAVLKEAGYDVIVAESPQSRWIKKNTRTVAIRLPEAEFLALKKYCEQNGITTHRFLRDAIDRVLK